ncbi:MAG: hypothetical protein WCR08_14265, partial [Gammaproteobacteria bacterium]
IVALAMPVARHTSETLIRRAPKIVESRQEIMNLALLRVLIDRGRLVYTYFQSNDKPFFHGSCSELALP